MIWSLIYNNPEIELRVVLRDIGSADTLSVLMNTLMQYTLSTWSLLFGMNGSLCGLWHRHFAWTQITLVLIGKGMRLDGSTLKTRTTLMNTATDSYYACEYACLDMYLYVYLLICTYVCILWWPVYLRGQSASRESFFHGLQVKHEQGALGARYKLPDTIAGTLGRMGKLYMSIVDV